MDKSDHVCDLGWLQHLSTGKVRWDFGDDSCDGQGQEQLARARGARSRAHGESSVEKTNTRKLTGLDTAESGGSAVTSELQEGDAKASSPLVTWAREPSPLSGPQVPL